MLIAMNKCCACIHNIFSYMKNRQPPAARVPAQMDRFVEVTSLGTSFTSGMSGLNLPQGGLDVIYIGEVWTSITLGRSRLHLDRGGLDFIYIGEVWTSFTPGRSGLHLSWGGLDLFYLGEVWTSFASERSWLHLPRRGNAEVAGSQIRERIIKNPNKRI